MFTIKPSLLRPSIIVSAKKNNFISSSDAPGEGSKRFPSIDNEPDKPTKDINPIKKFLMDVFKIKEIDINKFRKENKWAIRPDEKKDKD